MKVVLFGATGMVGQGVQRECLLDSDVESVLAIVRNPGLPQHDKLREIVHQDVYDLSPIEDRLSGYDACFFSLWLSHSFNNLQVTDGCVSPSNNVQGRLPMGCVMGCVQALFSTRFWKALDKNLDPLDILAKLIRVTRRKTLINP